MSHWVLIAVSIAIMAATSGCASTPSPNEVTTAYTSSNGIQSSRIPHEMFKLSRLPPIGLDEATLTQVQRASHVSEASNTSLDSQFNSDTAIDELIAFALANNPEIQAVHMQAHALEARVPQLAALDDPMLMTTTFLEPIQTAAGPQDVMLSISQKLPGFGKRALRGDVAYHEAQATFARMAAAELAVVEQVKLAYYEL